MPQRLAAPVKTSKMAAPIDNSTVFINLSSKITQLLYQRAKDDRNLIKKTLNDLNSINYKYPIVTNPAKGVLLINQCCTLISPENVDLVQTCCELMIKLITQQNVVVEGRTLTISVQWCLEALKGRNDNVVLLALEALLRANKYDVILDVLVNKPLMELARSRENLETTLIALQCLEACTYGNFQEKLKKHLEPCSEIFLDHLCNPETAVNLIYAKVFAVCLRGLQNITQQSPDLAQENLGLILGIIRTYMLYGIEGIDLIAPAKLLPSTLSIPEPPGCTRDKKGGKIAKQRKQRTQAIDKAKRAEDPEVTSREYIFPLTAPFSETHFETVNSDRLPTSDSDFSDTEGGNAAKLTVTAGRVRQAALQLFLQVVKVTEKNVMFSYWSSFIPENSLAGKHNLTTCILKDPSARGRMTALNVLLLLLISSKVNLGRAEKGERLAFTPFSVTIGLTVAELHKCLMLALKDRSIPVLTQVLKCLAALVQATPYHKLPAGIISEVIGNVKPFIYHKDHSVLVTSLIVLGCVLASEPIIAETRRVFVEAAPVENESRTPVPWILERCLLNLGVVAGCERKVPTHTANAVKLESLQIISVMSRNYFADLQAPFLRYITRAVDAALCDKFNDVRFHAGRAVDFIGQAMSSYCNNDELNVISIGECLAFWQTILKGALTALLQDEQYAVLRAVGCDCLASMGSDVFEQLSREKQILCITLLFACTRDEETSVRGAAARALGIYVIYPSLREDPGFIVDTAETIYTMLHDDSLTVKTKAAWSLGNLSDALVLNNSNSNMVEEVPKNLLLKLLQVTVKSSSDADKIKTNIGRALGNILQLITEDLLKEKTFRNEVEKAIGVLVKSSTTGSNMKVRWNSCYAISSMMKNSALFTANIGWQPKVFEALKELVVNFRNFKVRINAAAALSSPAKREFYGQFYQPIWSSLCRALESAQNMEDFSEYKHRDHLVEQICLSLGFLITLLQRDDLGLVQDCVSLHFDFLKEQMRKVWDRLLPEKSTVLFDANSHVGQLKTNKNLNQDQRICLQQLAEILKQEF